MSHCLYFSTGRLCRELLQGKFHLLMLISHLITQNTMATKDFSQSSVSDTDTWQNACQVKTSTPDAPDPLRLGAVEGENGKRNDVIFCGNDNPSMNVVFFGGDVQDYSENMFVHRDNKHYEKWNLENMAQLLWKRFPQGHIWVVKPSSMHLKTFSAFNNFVDSDVMGCPTHSCGQGSWKHLSLLLGNSVKQVTQKENEGSLHSTVDIPLTLIGFSKGCVVLNQLLFDLPDAKTNNEPWQLFSKVEHMYWLDGGHNGGSKTWITDDDLLQQLAHTKIHVHSHITPYQAEDIFRKWIGKEQKKFVEKLKKFGAKVTNTRHFEGEERNLENHFNILKLF